MLKADGLRERKNWSQKAGYYSEGSVYSAFRDTVEAAEMMAGGVKLVSAAPDMLRAIGTAGDDVIPYSKSLFQSSDDLVRVQHVTSHEAAELIHQTQTLQGNGMINYAKVADTPGLSNVNKSQVAEQLGGPSGVDSVVEFSVPKKNLVIDDHNDVNLTNC